MSMSTFDKVRIPTGVYFNETGHISDTDYISYKFPIVGSLNPKEIKQVEAPSTTSPEPSPKPSPEPGGGGKDDTLLSLIFNPVTLLVISIIILLVLIFNENKNVMYY